MEMKMIWITLLILVIFGLSIHCSKGDERARWRTYTIKEGHHYPGGIHFGTCTRNLTFKFVLLKGAKYNDDTIGGWNKLYGFIYYPGAEHIESARFAWRTYEGQLKLGAYCYIDGRRYTKWLETVIETDITYIGNVQETDDLYMFQLCDSEGRRLEGCEIPKHRLINGIRFLSYPYFGGESVAPHDIEISIQD